MGLVIFINEDSGDKIAGPIECASSFCKDDEVWVGEDGYKVEVVLHCFDEVEDHDAIPGHPDISPAVTVLRQVTTVVRMSEL